MSSPYEKEWRLQDIVAAIQVMGAHEYEKLLIDKWAERLKRPRSADSWETVFTEHPEFFTIETHDHRAALTWRRAYYPYFYVEEMRELAPSEVSGLDEEQRKKLSRKPLETGQIQALISTAISLHSSALAQREEYRAQQTELRAWRAELRTDQEELRKQQAELRARKEAALWWIPLLAAILSFAGAILGVILKK